MFTQKCFIRKNTPELRKKLDEIGRDFVQNGYGEWHVNVEKNEYLFCGDEPFAGDVLCYYMGRVCKPTEGVDCGTNEELFLAIAALRDDSDKHQYFTNGVFWIKCSQLELKHELDNNYEEFCVADFHKATVEELIEHFKP